MINNVAGTASILNACANSNVKKVILANTVWVYNAADKTAGKKVNDNIILDEKSKILPGVGATFILLLSFVLSLLLRTLNRLKT